jgi:hypothetical protein
MTKNHFILTALLLFCSVAIFAQQPTQSIRGRVIDADTKMGVPGVNVILLDSDPLIGVATDAAGNFRLAGVPLGRVGLRISSLGFEEQVVSNLLVIAGKESVLEIEIRESFLGLGEFVVKSGADKTEIGNEMALVSARNFSVEETKRFAGSFNDPARMAAAYAGVNSDGAGNNDITVRGNNSRFIQWKLEGVEIANPNHFGNEGLTGGPISALNSQMLANSEFYTGAFSPSYGNALAGIFDMKLRKGNNEKHEQAFSIGVLGTDVTLEGPLYNNASYLVNYRYSTLGLLDNLGVVDFSGVPKYQDLSFKFHLPTKSLGTFSVFGLGGKSGMDLEFFEENDPTLLTEKANQSSDLAILGINHFMPLNSSAFFQTSVSYATNGSGFSNSVPTDDGAFREESKGVLENRTLRAASTLSYKVNSRHLAEAGVVYSGFDFDLNSSYFDRMLGQRVNSLGQTGDANLVQGFISWRWRINPQVTMVNGLHTQRNSLQQAATFEPRSALRWELAHRQALTAGFGIHSKMTSLTNYFAQVRDSEGETLLPNKNLGFLKARHLVIGYENKLADQLFLKVEAYHQYLFDIPIDPETQSSYSLLNQDELWTDRNLVNAGKGENYGVELTLEKFFSDRYYFLFTGSLFSSTYVAGDGIWRNSRFNGNYLGNFLFGKEFLLRSSGGKLKVLGVNGRTALLGGKRLLPIDTGASIAAGHVVYDELRAFETKNDDIFTLNIGITYRVDKKKFSQELKLDVQNVTGNKAITDYFWNNTSQKIETIPQLTTLPVLSYTIHF